MRDEICRALLNKKLNKWFHTFPWLIKVVYKTTFQNSVFKFSSSLVIFFINFGCLIKSTNVFRDTHTHSRAHTHTNTHTHTHTHTHYIKSFSPTICFYSQNKLEKHCVSCWVGSRFLEKPHWKRSFLGILLAYCLKANWFTHHF